MAGRPPTLSLRWRLLRAVFVTVLLLLGVNGALSYRQAQEEAEELMDGNLAQSARLLLALVRGNESHLEDLGERLARVRSEARGVYEPPLEFQIGRGDGTILLRSANAPAIPVLGAPGYSEIQRDGQAWRMLILTSVSGDYRVQVAQALDARERAALEVAGKAAGPSVLILPVLLLLLYVSIRRGLRPLDRLAADVAARSADNLGPLPKAEVPQEARPLVAALNRLLARLERTLDNERRFTADAAHELRTPLAALRVHAQVALASAGGEDRDHALRQVVAGVERTTRLVEQLLRLARLDPLTAPPHQEPVDLNALMEAAAAIGSAQAEGGERLRLWPAPSLAVVFGDPELLQIALRNLMDNALRYSGEGSPVDVAAIRAEGRWQLRVSDSGPGIPAPELDRICERFVRGEAATQEGSGLGLAIVRRIAELHHADLVLRNREEGGLEADLRFSAG